MLCDFLGALFSLAYIYYFIRLDNKAWYIGILASCINTWTYWEKGIYADMCLEIFYFFSMVYGSYKWQNQSNEPMVLKQLSRTHWLLLSLLFVLGFILIYQILISFTLSTIPIIDTLTTTLSLTAQWLMCHKSIITWILWLIVDLLYTALYVIKSLPFHAFLMLIYTGMAITGYLMWARVAKNNTSKLANDPIENKIKSHDLILSFKD